MDVTRVINILLINCVYKGAGTSKVNNPKTVAELMGAFMHENGNTVADAASSAWESVKDGWNKF